MEPLAGADPRSAGPYTLLGKLGSGGMGAVYLGRSSGGRIVAVKIVRPELGGDSEFRDRFRREIQAARSVSGAFTAPVVDADPDAEAPWMATAYVPGISLNDAVRKHGPLGEAALRTLGMGLVEALTEIHRAGLTHRDMKPSNVLLAADGPHVIDFGISRAADSTALTAAGFIVGSPGFMSPEQITGPEAGPSGDLFSLAATLVFAAGGQGPFGDGPPQALLYRVVTAEPDVSAVPPALRTAVLAMLAKSPDKRPTVEQAGQALLGAASAPEAATAAIGAWLPPAYLTDIAAASTALTLGSTGENAPGQQAGQGQGSQTPQPFAQPGVAMWSHPLQQAGQQSGQTTPLSQDPSNSGSNYQYPGPNTGGQYVGGQFQGPQYQGGPNQGMPPQQPFGESTAQQGSSTPKLSRRALLGIGGAVVLVGGGATAFALSGGNKPNPGPGPVTTTRSSGAPVSNNTTTAPSGSSTQAAGSTSAIPNSGSLSSTTAPTTTWTYTAHDSVQSLQYDNGTVYVYTNTTMEAIDVATGKSKWGGSVTDIGAASGGDDGQIPMLVSNGVLYMGGLSAGDASQELCAIDTGSGKKLWSLTSDSVELNGAYGIIGSTLYLVAYNIENEINELWAVDTTSHQLLWKTPSADVGALYVPSSGNLVYSFNTPIGGANGSTVTALDVTKKGAVAWSYPGSNAVFSSVSSIMTCYANDEVIIGGDNITALDPASGKVKWQKAYTAYTNYNSVYSNGGSTVYTSADGNLYAANAASSGAEIWSNSIGTDEFSIETAFVFDGNAMFVTGTTKGLYAVDVRTGGCRWQYDDTSLSSMEGVSVTAGGGNCYFGIGTSVTAFASV